MNTIREKRLVCSCELCKDLEKRYNLKPYSNWVPDSGWRMAIIPRKSSFSENTRISIFALFAIPESYKRVEYTEYLNRAWIAQTGRSVGEGEGFAYFCKFVDPIRKYQSGELWVLDEGDYFFCRMGFFELLTEEDRQFHELIDFTVLDMAHDISILRKMLRSSFSALIQSHHTIESQSGVFSSLTRRITSRASQLLKPRR